MKKRKTKDLESVLKKKGFTSKANKKRPNHKFFHLEYDNKITHIYTFLSHGAKSKEYDDGLMNKMKKQLKFPTSKDADDFFDCPMSYADYIDLLKDSGELE
jgi:hypothetical protein